jgi:hypothetical protein
MPKRDEIDETRHGPSSRTAAHVTKLRRGNGLDAGVVRSGAAQGCRQIEPGHVSEFFTQR